MTPGTQQPTRRRPRRRPLRQDEVAEATARTRVPSDVERRRAAAASPRRVERAARVARNASSHERRDQAAACASAFTLNGWRTRFSRSASAGWARRRSPRAAPPGRTPSRTARDTSRFGNSPHPGGTLSARSSAGAQVLVVRLVQHDDHGRAARDAMNALHRLRGRDPRAGRVVGIGDEHHAASSRAIAARITGEVVRRGRAPAPDDGAARRRASVASGVDRERVLREHGGRRPGRRHAVVRGADSRMSLEPLPSADPAGRRRLVAAARARRFSSVADGRPGTARRSVGRRERSRASADASSVRSGILVGRELHDRLAPVEPAVPARRSAIGFPGTGRARGRRT